MTDSVKRLVLPKCRAEHTNSQTASRKNLTNAITFVRYHSDNAIISGSSRNKRHIAITDKIRLNVTFRQQHIEQIAHLERLPRTRINDMTVSDGFCRQQRLLPSATRDAPQKFPHGP